MEYASKSIKELKEAWVHKNFGSRKSPYDVLRAVNKFQASRHVIDRELSTKAEPQLGMSILQAYLDPKNNKKLKTLCSGFPGTTRDHRKAVLRIITILKHHNRRYVWGMY